MYNWVRNIVFLGVIMVFAIFNSYAQISPGKLSKPHSKLEGLSNCTKCHILGNKVSNDKCLDCHKEIKQRIDQNLGYHSSTEIRGKDCFQCHNEHHGEKFELIRFDADKFNHSLTGYKLLGSHAGKDCKDCHKSEYIADKKIKEKEYTYLGLSTSCLSCHTDYHQKTLSNDCASCHDFKAFRPASYFDHSNTKFELLGKHNELDCLKCHKKELLNGQDFQNFSGVKFDNCTSCHEDTHNNKFGQNCIQCHSEISFHQIKAIKSFNHNLTSYRLEGRHKYVDCKQCHKTKLTDPVRHKRCTDCHKDYHNKQFVKQGITPDCSECHTNNGFSQSLYSIEQHNESSFKLEGAHLATPCFECHKKEDRWSFREIGLNCVDCHDNIHKPYLDVKYYPDASCKSCHSNESWSKIEFDHSKTNFNLEGAHLRQLCSACHTVKDPEGLAYPAIFRHFSQLYGMS